MRMQWPSVGGIEQAVATLRDWIEPQPGIVDRPPLLARICLASIVALILFFLTWAASQRAYPMPWLQAIGPRRQERVEP